MPMPSLFVGRTGIQANMRALQVVSDNVANVNTIGFKASRPEFIDILPTGFIGEQFGRGATIGEVRILHLQGTLEFTGLETDMAIDGDGFFVVKDVPRFGIYYTRNGQFEIDRNGFLVNRLVDGREGLRVQGWQVVTDERTGEIRRVGPMTDIKIPQVDSPPKATTRANFGINLDSRKDVIPSPPMPFFDPNDPTTYQFNTSVTVYDSLGTPRVINLFFRKIQEADPFDPNSRNVWEVLATVEGGTINFPPPDAFGNPVLGTLEFTKDGKLAAEKINGTLDKSLRIEVTWQNGQSSSPQTIEINFGTSLDEVNFGLTVPEPGVEIGLDGTTQFASPSSVNFVKQDGKAVGSLVKFTVEEDGTIIGFYSNGISRPIAQLAIAKFTNKDGLLRVGRTLFAETPRSGEPAFDKATVGGRGKIVAKSLEHSNVDLATEFINMIVFQRAFQASSRVIAVSDAMLVELAGLIR
jgi:flagellar hook protein FlgE